MTTRNFSERADVYQIITDRLVALLEQGTVPWRRTWKNAASQLPMNLVSGKRYTGVNVFMLGSTSFESPYWLTFKQAQERGGSVMRGEKGMPVIFCKTYRKETEDTDTGEITEKTAHCLRYYTVFNVEQCKGVDFPATPTPEESANKPIEIAERLVLAMPNAPRIEHIGNQPCYRPFFDIVEIPPIQRFDSSEEYYSTLFHELAHSTGHASRLNRNMTGGFGSEKYGKEELIAEMAASYLSAHCGFVDQNIENNAAYLRSWIKSLRGDKRLAISAASAAQAAANYIIG